MPDLSHRPTRYATAAVVAAVLAGTAVTTLGVHLGPDTRLAALQKKNAELLAAGKGKGKGAPKARSAPKKSTPKPGATPTPTTLTTATASARPLPSPSTPGALGSDLVADTAGRFLTVSRTLAPATPRPSTPTRGVATPAPPRGVSSPAPRRGTGAAAPRRGTGAAAPRGGTGAAAPPPAPTVPGRPPGSPVGPADCLRFETQEDAQAAFDADPVHFAALDGDHDGKACEMLRHRDVPAAPRPTPKEPAPPVALPPAPPPPPVKPTAPTKAALLGSGMHFGMATPTEEAFTSAEASLGRQADLRGYFSGFDTGFDADRVTAAWNDGQIPFLTWESRPLALSAPEDPASAQDFSLSRIADGSFDDYLTSYAKAVTATGLPLAIRFDQEMNGNWYRWAEFENPTAHPGDYIAAWRHVHDVFQAQGANAYVMWVWSPNRVDNLGRFPAIDNYYPGDDYVDEVGMTGYLRAEDKTPATFSGTYDKTLAELRRVAPTKPLLLSEVGATEDGGRKAAWLTDFFPGLVRNPDIAGFVWFDYAVTSKNHTDDWRIDSTTASFQAFKTGLTAISYGLDVGKRFTLRPRAGTTPVPAAAASRTPAVAAASRPRPARAGGAR